ELHVHVGAPLGPADGRLALTQQAHGAVTSAWRIAAAHLGEPAALAA
ncbi:1-acyl-sn-glycerol-3-phosphate acyltransferase, partial [Streptomyces sp. SID14478]|nr:1-acyl-sn-glycerol-3-phosphate acyltransferase [Streptomyces sp. SID14478]